MNRNEIESYWLSNAKFPVDATALTRYLDFIYSTKNEKNLVHKHHMLPKSSFIEYKSLKTNSWNCVKLSLNSHIQAHRLLCQVEPYSGNYRSGLARLLHTTDPIESNDLMKSLRWIHKDVIQLRVVLEAIPEYKALGWSIGCLHTRISRLHITNGKEDKRILPEDKECYLKVGWKIGRTALANKPGKNNLRCWINDGINCKFILKTDLGLYPTWKIGNLHLTKYVWINKDDVTKRILRDELQTHRSDGWLEGNRAAKGNTHTLNKKFIYNPITKEHKMVNEASSYLKDGWIIGKSPVLLSSSCSEGGKANKGKQHPKAKNKVWVTKEGVTTLIQKEKAPEFLIEGWVLGRKS